MNSINQRLQKVSQYIKGETIADIGSDHAYLPIYAIKNHLCQFAVAGEVVKGPFEAAKINVKKYGLDNSIDVKLGNGLEVLDQENNIDSITICGMGGPLIASIIEKGKSKLQNHPRLILQSNIQTITLRQALSNINYHIIDESLIEENGHIYEIVVAEYGNQFMDDFDLKFGPILLRQKNNLFTKKWNRELQALEKIKRNLDEDKHFNRLNEINKEIKMVQEVIL
ncbi:tRNA (adenine(22)-N(1))-methyltransferase [Staphylococcus carnosus]|uniref:Uncharacterized protein n=4 Tax=Staphylococcus carnosus TaxID=1281 RepID=B9DNN1_STACT|nr:tRNA (adenine(22)-N(1))-methyltransferase TrmK [Staphylococcus carnosus]ANZ33265.1 tRNA methyltransferase [Staphylococcus carnosus]KKB26167.1 tRNA methyltransferase [Staphylococcus carnosus]KOR13550.1 tRNA methyltransferase [Staphylococcus carnosus]QPT04215.1 tRNA (adenine-N(1))-methyltransferase [Staphylococcus carnosus]QQS85132.1 tRNA (adenine-N(1))-methyltransferase [Staphylococcus carnosus]